MARGDNLEPQAVGWLQAYFPELSIKDFNDEQKFVNFGIYGATPDAITCETSPVEIKCPHVIKDDTGIKELLQYLPQLYGQMHTTKSDECFLLLFNDVAPKLFRLEWNDEIWQWMTPKFQQFWTEVQKDVEPEGFARGEKAKLLDEFTKLCYSQRYEELESA
jgi:hypothetical protein